MIVVDLGCATYPEHPGDESIAKLIDRFKPEALYGFDAGPITVGMEYTQGDCRVRIRHEAAWTSDGELFVVAGDRNRLGIRAVTTVRDDHRLLGTVPCFDLAAFLTGLPEGEPVVLKMDVEGAEYVLMPYLWEAGVDSLLDLILVEWHTDPLILPWHCPVEDWE